MRGAYYSPAGGALRAEPLLPGPALAGPALFRIAAQTHRPLEEIPHDYGEYLEYLHRRGADVYANTAMLIVTGDGTKVQQKLPSFPFVAPAEYARVTGLLAQADQVIVY